MMLCTIKSSSLEVKVEAVDDCMQKLERLQSQLHMLGMPAERMHQVFVDDEASAREFDPSTYFDTPSSLLDHTYNRPRMNQLEAEDLTPQGEGAPQVAEHAERSGFSLL